MPSSKPGSTRKAICLLPLPLISMVDIWLTPDYFEMATKCMTGAYQKATPRTVRAVPRRLTTNDRISIEAAMKEHTQTHPKYQYRFRFLALCATGSAIIHITAPDEHAAREMSPTGFVMVFTARLPVEVRHA
ncbi:host cell division inhibitor Icd-like protein [Rahnella woolbedingensis]